MKRTTYIMIALLVAGLLLTSGFAFYLTLETPSPNERNWANRVWNKSVLCLFVNRLGWC